MHIRLLSVVGRLMVGITVITSSSPKNSICAGTYMLFALPILHNNFLDRARDAIDSMTKRRVPAGIAPYLLRGKCQVCLCEQCHGGQHSLRNPISWFLSSLPARRFTKLICCKSQDFCSFTRTSCGAGNAAEVSGNHLKLGFALRTTRRAYCAFQLSLSLRLCQ